VVADDLHKIIVQAGRGVNDVTRFRQFEVGAALMTVNG
jgi:hypothetical protein